MSAFTRCPLCEESFPTMRIARHAANCNGKAAERMKRKRVMADEMRPESTEEYQGDVPSIVQPFLNGSTSNHLPCLVFFGPSGTGKTTLAKLLASHWTNLGGRSHMLSAVTAKKKDFLDLVEKSSTPLLILLDEAHRWSKAQQDVILPFAENGTVTLIAMTTENPSFHLIPALLSRCHSISFEPLNNAIMQNILTRVLKIKDITMASDRQSSLIEVSKGDARRMINLLESHSSMDASDWPTLLTRYDVDTKYALISALHKTMRASDASAAVYYLQWMIEGGEDPLYIARRLVRFASEDCVQGALQEAMACFQAVQALGMPESDVILTQTVLFLSRYPKSREADEALSKAKKQREMMPDATVPKHLQNAPTKWMKEQGYATSSIPSHNFPPQWKESL